MSTLMWYDEYMHDWMRAFPLGNGRVAAMVYGDPHTETIEINEESLWSGRQLEETFESSPEILGNIRKLLFEGKNIEAARLCEETLLSKPRRVRFYESFGEIFVDFEDKSEYKNYKKQLELDKAVCSVSYEKNGTKYHSESFVSEEYDVLVYRLTGDKAFSCKLTMERKQDAFTSVLGDDTLVINGTVTFAENVVGYGQNNGHYGPGGEGMSFGARLYVDTDGTTYYDKTSLSVKNATYVTVYGAFATNYNVDKFDIDDSIDYKAKLKADIQRVRDVDYDDIKALHIKHHDDLFNKLVLTLDGPDYSQLPTDKRLEKYINGEYDDTGLIVLYYNYGRYLLITSSAGRATLPANLQGKWSSGFTPAWGSDYHTNINLQMNYWSAHNANMTEAFKPFIHFMKMISRFGVKTAKELYSSDGWAINHTTDIFGRTGIHDRVQSGFFPLAGPWLCMNLWEHYEYTGDVDYLSEIYPVLSGAVEFVSGFLVEDKDGYLVTSPSSSPENSYYYTDENGEKQQEMFTYGSTVDFEIIFALLTRVKHACKVLGIDGELTEHIDYVLSRIQPLGISERYGTIREWIEDYEEVEPGHRHVSHLFGLYPGDQINETAGAIYEAAKNTLNRRLTHGGAGTGWSRAWVICFCARFKDGDGALHHLNKLLEKSTGHNLFDTHPGIYPPFQIDGNFGAVAGLTEMLVQSHLGNCDERVIEILPALPKAWAKGSIRGVCVRGNFELDIEWQDCKPSKLRIISKLNNTFRLKCSYDVKSEKAYDISDGVLSMNFASGETAEIEFV